MILITKSFFFLEKHLPQGRLSIQRYVALAQFSDIVLKSPVPTTITKGTAQTASMFSFYIKLSLYNLQ